MTKNLYSEISLSKDELVYFLGLAGGNLGGQKDEYTAIRRGDNRRIYGGVYYLRDCSAQGRAEKIKGRRNDNLRPLSRLTFLSARRLTL